LTLHYRIFISLKNRVAFSQLLEGIKNYTKNRPTILDFYTEVISKKKRR